MLTKKRALGQYSTPVRTVDYMIRKIKTLTSASVPLILDPAAGDGIFIERLLRHGFPPESVHGFDIDPQAVQSIAHLPRIKHQDFLTFTGGSYDCIIGNPPYKSKRESKYIKSRKAALEQQFQAIGIQNMYSMFIHHAIANVKEGGVICFIVQDSFLTNVYYRKFRRYLLDHCLIEEILLAPRKLFHHTHADVRTAIVTLIKCTGEEHAEKRSSHLMRLVDRLEKEEEYDSPPEHKVQILEQRYFENMEHYNFCINVPVSIHKLISETPVKLGHVVQGGTGISTGNDAKFLKKASELAETETDWVPFYKNGGMRDAWYYHTPYRIHKDWESPSRRYQDFMARNSRYYFQEGITCSSMGAAFSASYMPPGCLFGVNANFFADDREHLFYVLALLNSTLVKYIVRAVFNRTNMVTAGYLKRLPYVEPDSSRKRRIAAIAEQIVKRKQADPGYDASGDERIIDASIYEIYGISEADRLKMETFCNNIYETL